MRYLKVSWKRAAFLAVATIGFAVLPSMSSVFAQESTETVAAEQEVAAIQASPRATLQTFLTAMNDVNAGDDAQWPRALACLWIEGLTDEEARALAGQVFEVLNAFNFDLEIVPEEGAESPFELVLSEDVTIEIRRNEDGLWRFGRSAFERDAGELARAAAEEGDKQAQQIDDRVDPRVASPRATMTTFLGAFVADPVAVDDAVAALDLRHIESNVRADKGEELAFRLYEILTRGERIVPQRFPADPENKTSIEVLRDPNRLSRRIRLDRVPLEEERAIIEDGETPEESESLYEWKFSKRTLDDLDAMWEETFRDRPQLWGRFIGGNRPLGLVMRDYMRERAPFLVREDVVLENWQWVGLLVVILLGMIVSRLAGLVLIFVVRRALRDDASSRDTKAETDFERPIRIAIMAWVWWIALSVLSLPDTAQSFLKTIVVTLSSGAAVWAVYRLVDIFGVYLRKKASQTDNRYDDMVVPLIVRSLKVFVVAAGIVFIAEMNDWDYTSVLAGLGIGGLAFALAARDTVSNLFGSLTLLFDRPFQIGDWVQIDGVDGDVESVGMRSTRIRTFYNSRVSIPNANLTNATIDNYGARRYRRFKTNLGITYDTPPDTIEAFCEGIRELIRQHPYTRKDYFHVYLNTFGDSSLNVLLYCFFECPDWSIELQERHKLMLDIIRLAQRLEVEFAFPTRTLHMAQDGVDADGTAAGDGGDALELGRREAGAVFKGRGKG